MSDVPSFLSNPYRMALAPEHTNWTLRKIADSYNPPDEKTGAGNDGVLYIPPSQRKWAWKKGDKQVRLIDSIGLNFPIGSIILNKKFEAGRERFQIYDGRHRVETIHGFLNDAFKVWSRKFSELSALEKHILQTTMIPVVIVENATDDQLSEIFDRLNSGKPLSNKDHCWNWKNSRLISSTLAVVLRNNERINSIFNLRYEDESDVRNDLPDWVGLALGLAKNNSAYMTTSWIRLAPHKDEDVDTAAVQAGLDALFTLLTEANRISPLSRTAKYKEYKKLGFINAFFLADWMVATSPAAINTKWLAVIAHIRKEDNKDLVKVSGAQNLDSRKIEQIHERVNTWYATGTAAAADDAGSDSDETDDEDTE